MSRGYLYKEFGPKLLEAVTLVIKEEINTLRTSLHLPERTNSQIETALENKLKNIPDYDWMEEGI